MAKNAEVDEKSNGHGTYEEFENELKRQGFPVVDGQDVLRDGIGLLQPPETRHSNAAIIAGVPNFKDIYDPKKEKEKGVLLDLMARTNFKNQKQMDLFLDWVEWCEDFGTGYDGPMRWCVAINSEGGLARQQYVDAITTYRFRNYGTNNKNERIHQPEQRKDPLP